MWEKLPKEQREEYKKMILAFASLTEMFAQKAESDDEKVKLSPIVNSKYQETVFQKVFHASAEDIGNTSYDAALCNKNDDGTETKYLIGIKTFGFSSGYQKIAQFKANHDEWSEIINKIKNNAKSLNTKEEIDNINKELYKELATKISEIRNLRILSSIAKLKGFSVSIEKDDVQAVYHVLMPSAKNEEQPFICVGETSYNSINLQKIKILGCTSKNNPTNFSFEDENHKYKFTSADSQLLMDFKNSEIVKEKWNVIYVENAYEIFSDLADRIFEKQEKNIESHSWLISVEKYSGFNNFFGLGSKLGELDREKRIKKLHSQFENLISQEKLDLVLDTTKHYLLTKTSTKDEKYTKEALREEIVKMLESIENQDFKDKITKLIFRPVEEIYIPVPNSKNFHEKYPNFFGKDFGKFKQDEPSKLLLPENERRFNMIFEPSGEKVLGHITQDFGKGIASAENQSLLGHWILRDIFQLKEYEPLTEKRLNEIGINGIRFYKQKDSDDIHVEFIWIDVENPPEDFFSKES